MWILVLEGLESSVNLNFRSWKDSRPISEDGHLFWLQREEWLHVDLPIYLQTWTEVLIICCRLPWFSSCGKHKSGPLWIARSRVPCSNFQPADIESVASPIGLVSTTTTIFGLWFGFWYLWNWQSVGDFARLASPVRTLLLLPIGRPRMSSGCCIIWLPHKAYVNRKVSFLSFGSSDRFHLTPYRRSFAVCLAIFRWGAPRRRQFDTKIFEICGRFANKG